MDVVKGKGAAMLCYRRARFLFRGEYDSTNGLVVQRIVERMTGAFDCFEIAFVV